MCDESYTFIYSWRSTGDHIAEHNQHRRQISTTHSGRSPTPQKITYNEKNSCQLLVLYIKVYFECGREAFMIV